MRAAETKVKKLDAELAKIRLGGTVVLKSLMLIWNQSSLFI